MLGSHYTELSTQLPAGGLLPDEGARSAEALRVVAASSGEAGRTPAWPRAANSTAVNLTAMIRRESALHASSSSRSWRCSDESSDAIHHVAEN